MFYIAPLVNEKTSYHLSSIYCLLYIFKVTDRLTDRKKDREALVLCVCVCVCVRRSDITHSLYLGWCAKYFFHQTNIVNNVLSKHMKSYLFEIMFF